jgi:hypothetical protein
VLFVLVRKGTPLRAPVAERTTAQIGNERSPASPQDESA